MRCSGPELGFTSGGISGLKPEPWIAICNVSWATLALPPWPILTGRSAAVSDGETVNGP